MRVTRVMDRVHDLNLQWIQEMGFIREIDQALSKSLMVEFLHLKVLMGEDLGETLRCVAGQHGGHHGQTPKKLRCSDPGEHHSAFPECCGEDSSPAISSSCPTEDGPPPNLAGQGP